MSQIEVSPGGVGFIRTTAQKNIPNAPKDGARRKSWLETGTTTVASKSGARKRVTSRRTKFA